MNSLSTFISELPIRTYLLSCFGGIICGTILFDLYPFSNDPIPKKINVILPQINEEDKTYKKKYKMVLVVRQRVDKCTVLPKCIHAVCNVGHMSSKIFPNKVANWSKDGQAKIVLRVKDQTELLQIFKNATINNIVTDIQYNDNGEAVLTALGPDYIEKIDMITGHLKLFY